MIYYAVALTVTFLLCYFQTTAYPLPGGAEFKSFRSFWTAFLVLLPLTFLLVFRWDVGYDSLYQSSYWIAYQNAAEGVNSREFELGFYWFFWLFAKLKVPYFWLLFTHGLLFMTAVCYAISKGSVWTRWSITVFFLLYVYFDAFSSLRQSWAEALSMIVWANMCYYPASKKRDLQNILLFLLASLFHATALINIPMYLISRIRFSRNGLLKFAILAVLLTPLLQVIIGFGMQLITGGRYSFAGFALINAVLTGVMFALCWYFYDDICALDDNAYLFVNLSLCIFVLLLNSGALMLPFRVFDMIKVGYVFIIPLLLRGIRQARVRFAVGCFVLAAFGAWFFNNYFLQSNPYDVYQWAFSDWNNIIHLP